MAAQYKNTSPYFNTSIVNNYLDVLSFRDIKAAPDDILFTVTKTYEYRPDLLAYDLYGDVDLWWVFAVRNPSTIQDSIFDLVAGVQIYLPQQGNIRTSLGL